VVSVAVSGLLLVGVSSTLYVATTALNTSGPTRDVLAASGGTQDVLGDLQYAITFTERSTNAVEFTVADRDADTFPETIRYSWSGTAGDPLTREYNGGAAVTIVEDVEEFDLSYITRAVTTTEQSGGPTTSPEIQLAFFESWPGLGGSTYGGTPLNGESWSAEYFTVNGVPPEATVLTITRVELEVAQSSIGTGDSFSVAIHECVAPGDPEPAVNPLGTPIVALESSLSTSFEWREFTFSDVVINSPTSEYIIVMKGTSSGTNYDVQWMRWSNTAAPADSTIAMWTTDGGSKWNPKANKQDDYDCTFRVYGTYETPGGGSVEVTRYFLNSIDVKLRVGSETAARIDDGVPVLNAPEVPDP